MSDEDLLSPPNAAATPASSAAPAEDDVCANDQDTIPAGVNLQRKSSVQFLVNSSSSLAAITGLMLRGSPTRTLRAANNEGGESGGGVWSPGDSRDRPFDIDSPEDSSRNGGNSRTSPFGVAAGLTHFRRIPAVTGDQSATADSVHGPNYKISNKELRRAVYHHERDRRTVSGLRVHAFTRQAFFSSFAVGLAIGSILAIILKILKDLTFRIIR